MQRPFQSRAANAYSARNALTSFALLVLGSLLLWPPQPAHAAGGKQCISKWGRTVCGYDCKAKFGRVKCAKTPQGRCTIEHGVVKCWDPKGAGVAAKRQGKAQCLSAYGKTECGYGCVKAFGTIRCAQTPGDRCHKGKGRITCSDDKGPGWRPPVVEPTVMPQGQCVTKFGVTRCGYRCVSKYNQVACADTPAGVCRAAYGRITCWDPPYYRPGMKRAQCVTSYGTVACGYRCVAKYGQAKCASTPQGVCTAAYGKVTCWDPKVVAPKIPKESKKRVRK